VVQEKEEVKDFFNFTLHIETIKLFIIIDEKSLCEAISCRDFYVVNKMDKINPYSVS
jgi:hypothetical protein